MITIEAGVLAGAMKRAAAVTARRDVIPILSHVMLRAAGDALEIVTSDLDTEYAETLPLAGGGALATTVDAQRLAAVAGVANKGAQIALELADKRLTVKSGRSRWVLPVLPVDDFPRIVFKAEAAATIAMPGKDLAEVLTRVLWSAGTEEVRYYLNGPLLHGEDGQVALAATNGHVLMRVVTGVDLPEGAPDVILMAKWCRTVEALAREADTASITWDARMARATIGAVTLTGKTIDGTFPDYRRVIPPEAGDPVTVAPAALREAIGKVAVMAEDRTRGLKLEREAGLLRLSCSGPDSGTAVAEAPAECAAGYAVGFNARYLEQVLAAIGGDSVVIDGADAGAPHLIRRAAADGCLGVVMPMRV